MIFIGINITTDYMLNLYQMKQLNLHNYIIYLLIKKYESI